MRRPSAPCHISTARSGHHVRGASGAVRDEGDAAGGAGGTGPGGAGGVGVTGAGDSVGMACTVRAQAPEGVRQPPFIANKIDSCLRYPHKPWSLISLILFVIGASVAEPVHHLLPLTSVVVSSAGPPAAGNGSQFYTSPPMSFLSWLLRATLMLSFVLGTSVHAGGTLGTAQIANASVAMSAATMQAHCADEQTSDHQAHQAHHAHQALDAEVDAPASDAEHDPASGCCQISSCHCAGSHCASCVAGPVTSAHGALRHAAASFSRSVYGSPALALSIRPPIA